MDFITTDLILYLGLRGAKMKKQGVIMWLNFRTVYNK